MIFTIKNNVPTIDLMGLNIPEFKAIWKADKNRNKSKAKGELAYIYHMVSANSPYFSYQESEREKAIITDYIPKEIQDRWKPSDKVKAGIEKFSKIYPNDSPSIRMLKAANNTADKLADYFENIDFTERDDQGQLIYDAKKVVDTLKSLSGVVKAISELQDAVKKDSLDTDVKVTGGATFSILEELQ